TTTTRGFQAGGEWNSRRGAARTEGTRELPKEPRQGAPRPGVEVGEEPLLAGHDVPADRIVELRAGRRRLQLERPRVAPESAAPDETGLVERGDDAARRALVERQPRGELVQSERAEALDRLERVALVDRESAGAGPVAVAKLVEAEHLLERLVEVR